MDFSKEFGVKTSWNWLFNKFISEHPNDWNKIQNILENNNFLPTKENVFRCFKYFEIEETRIVILGQDPYPNKIDACGLSFSVERNNKLPKSLNNIFAELQRDKNIIKKDGDLKPWAEQGVLLLNTLLTFDTDAQKGNKEWKKFTEFILNNLNSDTLFVCFGLNAISVCMDKKNKICTSHPSPLGFKKEGKNFIPFYNSKVFSKINEYLKSINKHEINW